MLNVFSPGFESPYTPVYDRGSGDWDVRHNLTGSALYSLPDLKGSNSFVRTALGGWQTSGIIQTRSGLPTNITLVSGFFGNPVRPDYVPGQPLWVPNHSWPGSSYNINAFAVEPTYDGTPGATIGTVGRNSLRGPAYFQLDLSGMKNFAITERVTMQFRADIFNIFNHPNFENPTAAYATLCSPPQQLLRQVARSLNGVPDINSTFGRRRPNHRRCGRNANRRRHCAASPILTQVHFLITQPPLTTAATIDRCCRIFKMSRASEGKCRSHTSRITISIPSVRVSDSRDGCEMGWDAIGRRLKASVRPGRFVICVECYPGCFEKEIEKQLVSALKPQIVLRAEECYLPESAIQSLCARDLGDDPVFAFMGKYELSEFLDERELAKQRSRLQPGIGPRARHWHGRNSSRRTVGPAHLLRHGEVGDPAAPASRRSYEPWFAELRRNVRKQSINAPTLSTGVSPTA